jgi:hypothetical protein
LGQTPSRDEHRKIAADGCQQAPDDVDDNTHHEGPLHPDNIGELATEEHEGGHHQRVESDGTLHSGDRRVQVFYESLDGHIHDRVVHNDHKRSQSHQEGEPADVGGLHWSALCQKAPRSPTAALVAARICVQQRSPDTACSTARV